LFIIEHKNYGRIKDIKSLKIGVKTLMKKKKFIIIGVLAVVLLAILGVIWSVFQPDKKKETSHYETLVAQKALPLTLSGNVSPKETRMFMVTKKNLAQMEVKDGQKVTNGQVLYTTYNQANANELDELNITLAKYQRARNLANQKLQDAKNALSKLGVDDEGYSEAKDAVASANEEVADANDSLNATQRKINQVSQEVSPNSVAPFDGDVEVKYDENGNAKVTVNSAALELVATVSEYDYAKVKAGDNVKVSAVATGKKQEAVISLVDTHPTSANNSNGAKYKLYGDLDANKFIDGQTLKIKVPQAGVVISKSCVYQGKVYLVEDGKVESQVVKGHEVDGQYIVTAGLEAGQKVVVNPDGDLKEGEKLP